MKTTASKDSVKKSTPVTFQTTILKTGENTAGIKVPDEVIEKLGGQASAGESDHKELHLPKCSGRHGRQVHGLFELEHRMAAGVQGGDKVDVTLALDLEPAPSSCRKIWRPP
jgi:hypothetical protein